MLDAVTPFPVFPAVPVTADELATRWAIRDAEYAKQRLEPEAIHAIRDARKREASLLPTVAERARMFARAECWAPPKSQDYGSMKDWLE